MEKDLERLKKIATNFGWSCEISKHEDGSYIDFVIRKDDRDLFVIFPKHGGVYVAYDLTSSGLPREIYPDTPPDYFSDKQRSTEVIINIESILSKSLQFYKAPGLFNKNKGYITLPIDGRIQKIFQKSNYFNLPIAA